MSNPLSVRLRSDLAAQVLMLPRVVAHAGLPVTCKGAGRALFSVSAPADSPVFTAPALTGSAPSSKRHHKS